MEPVRDDYPLVVIVGPTAAGKSALAVSLAERSSGEIVNCDSVQVYRGFDVGSGKLPPGERRGIPHHLLDLVEPDQTFTAGDYEREARSVLASIRERENLPIVVGGTGLYLRALLAGLFAGPPRSEALRARLAGIAERRGREFLSRMLRKFDPKAAARIHRRDLQKVVRALEVCLLARQPLSRMHARGRQALEGFRVVKIGLNPDPKQLNSRIDARVQRMFSRGLVEEARAGLERTKRSGRDAKPLAPFGALGYRQASAVLCGKMSLENAVREAQKATRRYAKRQRTWFRGEPRVTWFEGFGDNPEIQQQVFGWLETILPAAAGLATSAFALRPMEGTES